MTVEGESLHDRRSKIRTAVKYLIASFLLGACSDSAPSQAQAPAAGTPGVAELSVCEDCPVFVKVPAAPAPLRPIRYVSKFELTWNNYLAAYDGGACTIPNPNAPPQLSGPNDILPHLDKYRIDWPVTKLGVRDIQCYIDWLQKKTNYRVALPTAVGDRYSADVAIRLILIEGGKGQ